MEAKKTPRHDLHRQSLKYRLIGLIISMAIVITAFEWKSIKEVKATRTVDGLPEAFLPVMPDVNEEKPSPVLPTTNKTKPVISQPVLTFTESKENHSGSDRNLVLQPDESGEFNTVPPLEDDSTVIHVMAEVPPLPVGGYEAFYSLLSKKMKYPKQALRQGIEGNIFIEFVIDKKGSVSQWKVIKGIGGGCDEEALRLLKLTSWEPGRQRGKAVNVRMVIPIKFKIRD